MMFRKSVYSLGGLVVVLATGCTMDMADAGLDQMEPEQTASVQEKLDPITAAAALAAASKDVVDTVDKIKGWFDDPSPASGYDPRVDQILSELYHLRSALYNLSQQLTAVIAALQAQLDTQERQAVKRDLEDRHAAALTAIDRLADWKNSNKKDAAALNDAMAYSELGLNYFAQGGEGATFYYSDHKGGTKWDYHVAAPYYVFALGARVAVLAAKYGNAYRVPASDGTTLKNHATMLEAISKKGEQWIVNCGTDEYTMLRDNSYVTFDPMDWYHQNPIVHPPTKYEIIQGCIDSYAGAPIPTAIAPFCYADLVGFCASHDFDKPDTWYNYTTAAKAESMRQTYRNLGIPLSKASIGLSEFDKLAIALRRVADFRRLITIPPLH